MGGIWILVSDHKIFQSLEDMWPVFGFSIVLKFGRFPNSTATKAFAKLQSNEYFNTQSHGIKAFWNLTVKASLQILKQGPGDAFLCQSTASQGLVQQKYRKKCDVHILDNQKDGAWPHRYTVAPPYHSIIVYYNSILHEE